MKITEKGVQKLEDKMNSLHPKISKELETEINNGMLDLGEYYFKQIQEGSRTMPSDPELAKDYVTLLNVYVLGALTVR